MATLYVTEPGARIEKEYERILVTKEDEVLFSAPIRHISEVVLIGYCGATTPAMLSLLDHGIPLTMVTASGKLRGRLIPPQGKNNLIRKEQVLASMDNRFCLDVSREIVKGKIHNCRVIVQRIKRGVKAKNQPRRLLEIERTESELYSLMVRCENAISNSQLMGLEGISAKIYFREFRYALMAGATPFAKRTRRPPKDPINALLSLAYTLLQNAIYSAVEIADLDPYLGLFHSNVYGRPALVLDLMEEFRPVIADCIALKAVRQRIIKADDFIQDGETGEYTLSRKALRKYIRLFIWRIRQSFFYPPAGRALTYQKIFEVQANHLRCCISNHAEKYQPFLIK